jgi:hypothetical protein
MIAVNKFYGYLPKQKNNMTHLSATKKGIFISVILILTSIICFYVFHLPDNGKSQYLILCLYIAGILWVLMSYKIRTDYAGLKEYFSEAFKAFIVITLLMTLYTYIFQKLNPQILENGIKENNLLLQKQGNKTPMEINENAEKLRSIFMPMMLMLNTIKFLILGVLVSIVTAGFLSQKNNSAANS